MTDNITGYKVIEPDEIMTPIPYSEPDDGGYKVVSQDEALQAARAKLGEYFDAVEKSKAPKEVKDRYINELKALDTKLVSEYDSEGLEAPKVGIFETVAFAGAEAYLAAKPITAAIKLGLEGASKSLAAKTAAKAFFKTIGLVAATDEITEGTIEAVDSKMNKDVPWYVKAPIDLGVGLVTGVGSWATLDKAGLTLTKAAQKSLASKLSVPEKAVEDTFATIDKQVKTEAALSSTLINFERDKVLKDTVAELQDLRATLGPVSKSKEKVAITIDDSKKAVKEATETLKDIKSTLESPLETKRSTTLDLDLENPIDEPGKSFAGFEEVKKAGKNYFSKDLLKSAKNTEDLLREPEAMNQTIKALKAKKFEGIQDFDTGLRFTGESREEVITGYQRNRAKYNFSELTQPATTTPAPGKYAGLSAIKQGAKDIFPESFQAAESIDEFFLSKKHAEKLIEKLKDQDYIGIIKGARGYDFTSGQLTISDLELLKLAEQCSGDNAVLPTSKGLLHGIIWDKVKQKITGFNPFKALMSFWPSKYDDMVYSFISGPKGRKITEDELQTIAKLEALGNTPEEIALKTGWVRLSNGSLAAFKPEAELALKANWREHLEDPNKTTHITDIVDYPDFEKYYGKTVGKLVKIVPADEYTFSNGFYNPITKTITLNARQLKDNRKAVLEVLNHETTHAIAHYEGLPQGGSSTAFGEIYDLYEKAKAKSSSERTIEDVMLTKLVDAVIAKFTPEEQIKFATESKMWKTVTFGKLAYKHILGEQLARSSSYRKGFEKEVIQKLADPQFFDAEPIYKYCFGKRALWLQAFEKGVDTLASKKVKSNFFTKWEDLMNTQVIQPLTHWADLKITNQTARTLLGIDMPKEFRALSDKYMRESNILLKDINNLAVEIYKRAPTEAEQAKVVELLHGKTTTKDPILASKVQEVHNLWEKMHAKNIELGIKSKTLYDKLTESDMKHLKKLIDTSTDPEVVDKARQIYQQQLNSGPYDYIPVFLKSREGIVGRQKKELKKLLAKYQVIVHQAKDIYPEDLEFAKEKIAMIEDLLKVGSAGTINAERKLLSLSDKGIHISMDPELSHYLGKVDEDVILSGSYTVARGFGEEALNVSRFKFLNAIKENPNWVLDPKTDPEMVPAHFRKASGKSWGPLQGYYVDRKIADNITDIKEHVNGFLRGYDKVIGWWKYGKAVLNPATHVGNFTANSMLAYFAGVNPWDVDVYRSAFQALKMGPVNKWYALAKPTGMLNDTFAAAELSQFKKDLTKFREMPSTITTGQKVKDFIEYSLTKPSQAYEKSEQLFKMAVFIKFVKKGWSPEAAAARAEEYLFNYRDIPPIVRHYKRFASPFFTFYYKASGLAPKVILRHPEKVAALAATYAGWQYIAEKKTGVTDAQIKAAKTLSPSVDSFSLLLPKTSIEGDPIFWDVGRLVPFGQYGDTWGQTGLPIGGLAPTANPFINIFYAIATNRDMFTGSDLVSPELDSLQERAQKWFSYTWKNMLPSLVPGGYGFDRIAKGVKAINADMRDYTGQRVTLTDSLMRTILGIKTTIVTKEAVNAAYKGTLGKMTIDVGRRIHKVKMMYKRHEIDSHEMNAAIGKLRQQKKLYKAMLRDARSAF